MMKKLIAVGVFVLLLLAVVFAAITQVEPPAVPDFGGVSSASGQSVAQYLKDFDAKILTNAPVSTPPASSSVAVVSPPAGP